jgi:hypothetical protein
LNPIVSGVLKLEDLASLNPGVLGENCRWQFARESTLAN